MTNNPLCVFTKLILNKEKNKNIDIIEDILHFTDDLIKCDELIQNKKEIIRKTVIEIYEKYLKNIKSKEDFSMFLTNFLMLSKEILLNQDISFYIELINDIKVQIKSYQEIISYLYIYSVPKEINFPNFDKKLKDVLANIQLDKNDKDILSKIAILIPEYCEQYKYIQNFELIGKKFGKAFKNSPTHENLAKLIAVISLGSASVLNISPYLIQCLSVSSFLLP